MQGFAIHVAGGHEHALGDFATQFARGEVGDDDDLLTDERGGIFDKITDAVTEITSEKLRDVTWVIINEVKSGHWGVGGNAIGLDDVRTIMARD